MAETGRGWRNGRRGGVGEWREVEEREGEDREQRSLYFGLLRRVTQRKYSLRVQVTGRAPHGPPRW